MSDTSEFRMIKTIYEVCEKLDKAVVGDMVENVQDIIHTHAMIAAGSALIPVPGASTVATIGNIWTMYYNINQEVGVTLSKNALKSIASAVIANLGASTIVLAVSEAC